VHRLIERTRLLEFSATSQPESIFSPTCRRSRPFQTDESFAAAYTKAYGAAPDKSAAMGTAAAQV
jgi:hypothetical protein